VFAVLFLFANTWYKGQLSGWSIGLFGGCRHKHHPKARIPVGKEAEKLFL
jgi:hypothetical protein